MSAAVWKTAAVVEVLFDALSVTPLGAGPAEAACLALGTAVGRGWCREGIMALSITRLARLVVSPEQNPLGDGAPV